MFVQLSGRCPISDATLQSASLPAVAYDAYFMSKRYAIISEKGITVLDPNE